MRLISYFILFSLIFLTLSCQEKESERTITKIETEQSHYTIKDGEFLTINVIHTPVDLPAPEYDLTVGDSEILSDRTISELMIRGRKPGTSDVFIVTKGHPSLSAQCSVTVLPLDAESITLKEDNCEIKIGDEYQLYYEISPSDATYQEVEWSVEDEAIASVSQNGLICAKNVGETVVKVKITGTFLEATCKVSVLPVPVSSISFGTSKCEILIGDMLTISPVIAPSNATNKNVIWKTSNEDVATVDDNGNVQTLAVGEATISAETIDGGYKAEIDVSVHEIDHFVKRNISLDMYLSGSYTLYTLRLYVYTTNGKYINISKIELFNRVGDSRDVITNIGSCNEYTMRTTFTNGDKYGWYYYMWFTYDGKEYKKEFYNY